MSPVSKSMSLLDMTIGDISVGLINQHYTAQHLTEAYLARIQEALHFKAVLQVNPDALTIAKELDQELAREKSRGPLHGIGVLIKDNIVTEDKLDASAGSFMLLGAKPAKEATVVRKLRKAGAVILGKANLSEWANFRGHNISSGWSPRGGQPLGTYVPNSICEGSSSGSAVAVALGLCTAALGSETQGSIMDPAEIHNIVGLKPTRGLIGMDGAIPISKRQDVIGTLTRTVRDAAELLTIIAGRSETDPRTWDIPFKTIPDYTQYCTKTNLEGITIGIPRNAFSCDADSPLMQSFERAVDILEAAGATIINNANFSAAEEFSKVDRQTNSVVRSSDFKRDIEDYLSSLTINPNNIRTLDDIIDFTKTHAEEGYPKKDITNFEFTHANALDVDGSDYKRRLEKEIYYGGQGGILGAIEKHKLDVLVVPSVLGMSNDLAAKMGFPIMAVPLGFWPEGTPVEKDHREPFLIKKAPGIPYCFTILTKAFSEDKLLQVAYAFEQLTKVRENGPKPFSPPTTELGTLKSKA